MEKKKVSRTSANASDTRTRRGFLKAALLSSASLALPIGSSAMSRRSNYSPTRSPQSQDLNAPLQNISDPKTPSQFVGDHPARAHAILWDKSEYLASKGGSPKPSRSVSVVVVGGGIAGLTAAYQLRDLSPLVLEQSLQFGGNARAERWGSLEYGIGSAYIPRPETNSNLAKLLSELGLDKKLRFEETQSEAALFQNHLKSPFWSGATFPKASDEFQRVLKALQKYEHDAYPSIPAKSPEARESLFALDRLTFSQWVRSNLGQIHPHIEEFFHEYCWDSLGGGYDELSAAQVLNFLSADLASGTAALPGGNGAIAEGLYQNLKNTLKPENLRAQSLVVNVSLEQNGVHVTYEDSAGALHTVAAKSVVISSPKFIARALVNGLSDAQSRAMHRIKYRAFLVANLLFNTKLKSKHFGAFRLKGEVPTGDPRTAEPGRPFSSMIFGSWASHDNSEHSALTLYKPFPFDGARGELSIPSSYAQMRSRFESEIPALLQLVGADVAQVSGLRITRWGHALPLAKAGLIADGTLELAARPVGGRIFFGQQDNWANPCVESAIEAAIDAAKSARSAAKLA